MKYASVTDVQAGFRQLNEEEQMRCTALVEEAGLVIDAYNAKAEPEIKKMVTCRMVRRQLGDGEGGAALFPVGASQGNASALGYSQSWTMSGGSVGELYLSKLEKRLLGVGNRIGTRSPLEGL